MNSNPHITSISSHLAQFHGPDERLGIFLAISVGRLMLRSVRRGLDWRTEFPDDKIRHVADWLRASLVNEASWISNVDDLGRPKKLLKYPSFEALVSEADNAMIIEAQKLGNIQLFEGDEALFAKLIDGMILVRLLTPSALDRESSVMQHCIGNGGYDGFLGNENHLFLSLRDKYGKPHATIEIKNCNIVQMQGKQNRPPIRKYIEKLIPFIQKKKYRVSVAASHLGYAIDNYGIWHDIYNLPEGLTLSGNLDLSGAAITKLPKNLIVGSLLLNDSPITALPEGLNVSGSLYLRRSAITALPDGLTIGGSLDLEYTAIAELPKGLNVGGSLYLRHSAITALPDGLTVGRFLDLRHSAISKLPKGLTIRGGLDLRHSAITALPEGLYVGESLHLKGNAITTLPKKFYVGGSLYLIEVPISKLPDGLIVDGNLDVSRTNISELPEGLTVGGYIDIQGTAIKQIPESVTDTTIIYHDAGTCTAAKFRQLNKRSDPLRLSSSDSSGIRHE